MSLLVVLGDVSGDECLIISARFYSNPARRCRLHPGILERLANALFWLQLCWVIAGFLLMIYLAVKVMPASGEPKRSRIGPPASLPSKPDLVVLGGYRFEVTQDASSTRPKVIELHPDRLDRSRRVR
ncbi:MAG TPA: hypothetical protein VFU50_00625 [Terriglobales bacterium]|nr:hypothetical protein [Terriglobales bacterium]